MKGQVAFEYMIIVAIILTLMVPLWSYITTVSDRSSQSLALSQAQSAANKIISACDLVYTQGEPTHLTIDVHIPTGVKEAYINDEKAIFFNLYYEGANVSVYSETIGVINGSVPNSEGIYKMNITAIGEYVNISY